MQSCQDCNESTLQLGLSGDLSLNAALYLVESFAAEPTTPEVLVQCAGRERVLHGLQGRDRKQTCIVDGTNRAGPGCE